MARVEETAPTATAAAGESTNEEKKKPPRKRMRKLFHAIREQMEFYFSDSNLRRDRFLKKEIDQSRDGYLPLALFQNFNKMKEICVDPLVIAKALSKCSEVLEVSEDNLHVRRRTAFQNESPDAVDGRTVYVESLPRNVDHEWIKRVFNDFGKVTYVSLPRYKSTGDPKGFAFVEFESLDAARMCCESLGAEDFQRARCFPKGSKQMLQLQKRAAAEDVQVDSAALGADLEGGCKTNIVETDGLKPDSDAPAVPDGEADASVTQYDSQPKARKRKPEQTCDEASPSKKANKKTRSGKKKRKRESSNEGTLSEECPIVKDEADVMAVSIASVQNDRLPPRTADADDRLSENGCSKSAIKKRKLDVQAEDADAHRLAAHEETIEDEGAHESSTRRRKKRKSTKGKVGKDLDKTELDVLKLKVIPKSQWLMLRKEYLTLQKTNMAALKKALQQHPVPGSSVAGVPTTSGNAADLLPATGGTAESSSKGAAKNATYVEFMPDVIVRVACSGAGTSRQAVKAVLPADVEYAYVDVADGQNEGYIRCKTKVAAERLCVMGAVGDLSFVAVRGTDELAYWDKLRADREQHRSRKKKPLPGTAVAKQQRGSQKIAHKAEKAAAAMAAAANDKSGGKHIRFEG